MLEVVWEFVVKEGARGQFELAYGPGGAWSRLFSTSPGFRGLTFIRDVRPPRRYLSIDVWDSEEQRQQALTEHSAAYAELGVFRALSEATVRRRGR